MTQRAGALWLERQTTAVMTVPSIFVRHERHYLLNPAHPRFPQVTVADQYRVEIDPRLTSRKLNVIQHGQPVEIRRKPPK
jgi:RES domain-containing protein